MSTVNPHYLGKSLPVAIPLPPVRKPRTQAPVAPPKPEAGVWDFLREDRPQVKRAPAKTCERKKTNSHSGTPLLLIGVSFLAIFATLAFSWPNGEFLQAMHSSANARGYDFNIPNRDYPWHEKVSYYVPRRPTNNPVEVIILGTIEGPGPYRLEFSSKKFLSSLSGWIVISNCIVFLCSISMIMRSGGKVRPTKAR